MQIFLVSWSIASALAFNADDPSNAVKQVLSGGVPSQAWRAARNQITERAQGANPPSPTGKCVVAKPQSCNSRQQVLIKELNKLPPGKLHQRMSKDRQEMSRLTMQLSTGMAAVHEEHEANHKAQKRPQNINQARQALLLERKATEEEFALKMREIGQETRSVAEAQQKASRTGSTLERQTAMREVQDQRRAISKKQSELQRTRSEYMRDFGKRMSDISRTARDPGSSRHAGHQEISQKKEKIRKDARLAMELKRESIEFATQIARTPGRGKPGAPTAAERLFPVYRSDEL